MAQLVENPPATRDSRVRFPGREDPLEKGTLPTPVSWPVESHGLYRLWVAKSRARLSDFQTYRSNGFPGDGRESACNAGDQGWIPESGRSPGEGSRTHSSILAWKIPGTEEPTARWATVMGSQSWIRLSGVCARAHTHTHTHTPPHTLDEDPDGPPA